MSGQLSVCILACNEQDHLARCLDAVRWADEIVVVVDAKSVDGSEKLARERADRVDVRRYVGDVEQKSHCVDLATNPWILIVDPDEIVSSDLRVEIEAALRTERSDVDGYEVNRLTHHLGRWIRHGDFYPDWKLRLFRRTCAHWVGRNPHGRVEVDGRVERFASPLAHFSYRNLSDHLERVQFFTDQAAGSLYAEGRRARWTDMVLRPPARFLRAYVLKLGLRDGTPGFVIAATTAFQVFLKYAKLWEAQRDRP